MERLAARVILLWGWQRALVATLAGAILALTQAPVDFPAAGFVSFTILVWLMDGIVVPSGSGPLRRLLSGFGTGWWFGFGYFLAGLYWVGNALLVDAEAFAWALPLAMIGLPAGLAIFHGLAAVLARILWSDHIGRLFALAFAFGSFELLRGTILTGFPWNAIGYGVMPLPVFMQSAAQVGLFGVTSLAVLLFSLPALLSGHAHRRAGLAIALVLMTAHGGYGLWRITQPLPDSDRTLQVRIVQPSIDQAAKWDEDERDAIFSRLMELTGLPPPNGTPPQIVVWPETSFPFLLTERPEALARIADVLQLGQRLLAGAVRTEPGVSGAERFYNSILSINDRGEIEDAFDKVHLVPFGEYLPVQGVLERAGLSHLASAFPAFSAGSQRGPLDIGGDVSALPFICYEVIFPSYFGDAANADVLLNVTNDAWFGLSPGPYQHLRQAQLRAVEAGRPMIRSANNGISAVMDARGRILDGFELDAVGALDVELPLASAADADPRRAQLAGFFILGFLGIATVVFRLRRGSLRR